MYCTRFMLGVAAAMMLSGIARGQVLIGPDVQNGSFELLGAVPGAFSAAKASNWDTDPDGDVTYWTDWTATFGGPSTAPGDSGTEDDPLPTHATNGTKIAFLQGDNAAFNLTDHIVQVGDVFDYTWDYVLAGRGNIIAQLAYEATPGGAIVPIAATTSTNGGAGNPLQLGIGNSYTALTGDPAIGRLLALTIQNVPATNYPEMDNVVLTANFLAGDVDLDGDVDLIEVNNDLISDFDIIRNHFRQAVTDYTLGDIVDNNMVDFADFRVWKDAFLGGGGSLAGVNLFGVPEPSTALLLLLGIVAAAGRRPRR